jgi:hypothetical protein
MADDLAAGGISEAEGGADPSYGIGVPFKFGVEVAPQGYV